MASALTAAGFPGAGGAQAGPADPVAHWNRQVLAAVRRAPLPPAAVARALAIVNTCVFDAWAAYDPLASPTRRDGPARRPRSEHTPANQVVALSYAAHRAGSDLFPGQQPALDAALRAQGLRPDAWTSGPDAPAAVGRAACDAVLADRHADGANQLGDMPGSSGRPYSDYTRYRPVNSPDALTDPSRWQPLRISASGGGPLVQHFETAHWSWVRPFALARASQFRTTTAPPQFGTSAYAEQADAVLSLSANLDDREKAIAEFWADGPGTDTPPGHWARIAGFCAERDRMTLTESVVLSFALGNALLDASIVAWDNK